MSASPLSLLDDKNMGSGPFAAYFSVSFGFHLLMVALLVVSGGYPGCQKRSFSGGVINVDLVSLPGPAPGPAGPVVAAPVSVAAPAPEVKVPAREKPVAVPKVKPEFVEKKSPTPAKPVKKEVQEDPLARTLAELDKKVEAQEDPVARTIAQLNREVSATPKSVNISGGGGGGQGGGGPGTGNGGRSASPLEIYNADMKVRIWANWVSPMNMPDSLKAVIAVHIAADGSLMDLRIEKRSGNDNYDESARKAVLKSVPLPPLPQGFLLHKVSLEFTPRDAQ